MSFAIDISEQGSASMEYLSASDSGVNINCEQKSNGSNTTENSEKWTQDDQFASNNFEKKMFFTRPTA